MTISLEKWWKSGQGRNSYTVFTCKNGSLSVYVRRNVLDKSVMEIASVSTISGFNGVRTLYRDFCKDIPAIAENVLNPELDSLLGKLGWYAYDCYGVSTRVNPEFQRRFTAYAEATSVYNAITKSRMLAEKAMRVTVPSGEMTIQVNPPAMDVLAMLDNSKWGILRGFIDGNNIYWWDADRAIHGQVANALDMYVHDSISDEDDVEGTTRLVLSKEPNGKPYLQVSSDLLDHPRLSRLIPRTTLS